MKILFFLFLQILKSDVKSNLKWNVIKIEKHKILFNFI